MILYDAEGCKYHFTKTRISSSAFRGYAWDFQIKTIDGVDYKFWYETWIGSYMYVNINNVWRKARWCDRRTGVGWLFESPKLFKKPPKEAI